MTEASWSRCQGADCIRLGGVSAGASVEVRPGASVTGAFPPMAGAVVPDGGDRCFVPRFPFVEGTTYTVTIDGAPAAVLERPAAVRPVTTEVLEIRPSATAVPRNFLRLYVSFSAPMSEGHADRHVRLLDEGGEVMAWGGRAGIGIGAGFKHPESALPLACREASARAANCLDRSGNSARAAAIEAFMASLGSLLKPVRRFSASCQKYCP